MFEIATRAKFRFPFKGQISTEDLWDLSVNDLDSVFKTLNSQAKKAKEESLLAVKTKEDETLTTMIDIVKHIVNVKLAEENAKIQAKERREKKQRIMEILASKQDAELLNKSADELKEMLAGLED